MYIYFLYYQNNKPAADELTPHAIELKIPLRGDSRVEIRGLFGSQFVHLPSTTTHALTTHLNTLYRFRCILLLLQSVVKIVLVYEDLSMFTSQRNPLQRQVMRYVLTGSIENTHRLFRAGLVSSPLYPFCLLDSETLKHIFGNAHAGKAYVTTTPYLLIFSR